MLGGGYECRRFMRCALQLPATFHVEGADAMSGSIVDISMSGMHVQLDKPVTITGECVIRFFVDALKPIEVRGRVIERKSEGVHFEIIGIKATCVESLRDVIVNAAEEPEACDTQMISNMDIMPELY